MPRRTPLWRIALHRAQALFPRSTFQHHHLHAAVVAAHGYRGKPQGTLLALQAMLRLGLVERAEGSSWRLTDKGRHHR
jgi:hypothetical protein